MNVLVQNCKIYNDASCDISADGQLLAAFIPSSQRGFPDEGILAVYSLAPHNLGEMLYTKRFGKHTARSQGGWGCENLRTSAFSKKCNSLNISSCSKRKHLLGHLASYRLSTAGERLVIWSGQVRCCYGGAAKEQFLFLKGLHCLRDRAPASRKCLTKFVTCAGLPVL